MAVADLNGDGSLDLAVANYGSNNVSILLGRGDGTFLAATNVGAGMGPKWLAIADFDGDHSPDLAVADSSSDEDFDLAGKRRRDIFASSEHSRRFRSGLGGQLEF